MAPSCCFRRYNAWNIQFALMGSAIALFGFLQQVDTQGGGLGESETVDKILLDEFALTIDVRIGGSAPTTQQNLTCVTPEGQTGRCGLLSGCQPYLRIADDFTARGIREFFAQRICKLSSTAVHICCPLASTNIQRPQLPGDLIIHTTTTTTPRPAPRPQRPQLLPQPTTPRPQRPTLPPTEKPPPLILLPSQPSPVQDPPNLLPPRDAPGQGTPSNSVRPPVILPSRPVVPPSSFPSQSSHVLPQVPQFFPNQQRPGQLQPIRPSQPTPVRTHQTSLPGGQNSGQNGGIFVPSNTQIVQQGPSPTGVQRPPQGSGNGFGGGVPPPPQNSLFPPPSRDRVPNFPIDSPVTQAPIRAALPSERECGSLPNTRRLGRDAWPWLAAVGILQSPGGLRAPGTSTFEVTCGGVLINRRHVLTPAHCISDSRLPTPTHVRLGDIDLSRSNDQSLPEDFTIIKAVDPGYDQTTFANDITILTLDRDVAFNDFVRPVCLPFRFRYDGFRYQNLSTVGWRQTVTGVRQIQEPTTANVLEFPVLGLSACRRLYRSSAQSLIIDRNQLCAGGGGSTSTECLNDSGAPLLFLDSETTQKYFVIGIVSLGFGCAQPESPMLYTRIGAYLDWIEQNV